MFIEIQEAKDYDVGNDTVSHTKKCKILSRWEGIFSSAKWSQLEIIGGWFPHVIKYFM